MTQRNEPPELVAVNPSWDVVPRVPSTTPPPRTAGPDDAAADGTSAMSTAPSRSGARCRTRTAAIRPPVVGGVAEGHGRVGCRTPPRQGALSVVVAVTSRLDAASGKSSCDLVHSVNCLEAVWCQSAPQSHAECRAVVPLVRSGAPRTPLLVGVKPTPRRVVTRSRRSHRSAFSRLDAYELPYLSCPVSMSAYEDVAARLGGTDWAGCADAVRRLA
jgi:hypothetical protein